MFFCCKTSTATRKEKEVDKAIADQIKQDKRAARHVAKMLLLGPGESGKSTIFKQMKILYGKPASEEERKHYTRVIYNNTVSAISILVQQAGIWGWGDEIKDKEAVAILNEAGEVPVIDEKLGGAIKALWNDDVVQKTWQRRNEFQVVDSMIYFFNKIDDLMKDSYLATENDYLYTRVRSTDVVKATYEIDGGIFEWYDVGGQRTERRKWIHCFSDVTALIFVAALSEYDQMLFEHLETNRIKEALSLFEDVCKLQYFDDSSIILFLNKHDLFLEKIKTHPIGRVPLWSDFRGGTDTQAGIDYFKQKFLVRAKRSNKTVYVHLTTATNTNNIKFVFECARDIILKKSLELSNF